MPQRTINQRLVEHGAIPLEDYAITESFRRDELFVRRRHRGDEPGWLVAKTWWDEQCGQWQGTGASVSSGKASG